MRLKPFRNFQKVLDKSNKKCYNNNVNKNKIKEKRYLIMTNKITKRDYFNRLLTIVAGDAELEQFIAHEIELLDKKSSGRKPTKNQEENGEIKKEILSVLSDGGNMTVTEIQKQSEQLGELSNQKVSALLRQLVDAGEVVKETDKKKSYFSLA